MAIYSGVLNRLATHEAHGCPMEKTKAQTEAEWVTHGNIARLEQTLGRETNEGRRTWIKGLLVEQRSLIVPDEPEGD
jgi:hypothetical protein